MSIYGYNRVLYICGIILLFVFLALHTGVYLISSQRDKSLRECTDRRVKSESEINESFNQEAQNPENQNLRIRALEKNNFDVAQDERNAEGKAFHDLELGNQVIKYILLLVACVVIGVASKMIPKRDK